MIIKNLAFVFPGQGSQYVGMGKDFFENYSIVRDIFLIANKTLGYNLSDIIFSGTENDLKRTEITQPAIYTLSYSIFKVLLEEKKISPSFIAGHSLGEYTALTAAEVFDFKDGIKLVAKRGDFIKKASEANKGGMIAVLGLEEVKIKELVGNLISNGIYIEIANYNSPIQTALSYKGDSSIAKKIIEYFKFNQAKKLVELNVSGPFHSSFMKQASLDIEKELVNFYMKTPKIPIVFNYNARTENNINPIKNCIVEQVKNSVKWVDTINFMIKNGVDTIIEIGPGKVLSGLNKKIDKNIKIYNIETIGDLSFNWGI